MKDYVDLTSLHNKHNIFSIRVCWNHEQSYRLRLYCLRATNLTPMDMGFGGRPGKSDPYLKVIQSMRYTPKERVVYDFLICRQLRSISF